MRRVPLFLASAMIATLVSVAAGASGELPSRGTRTLDAMAPVGPGETSYDLAAATLPRGDEPGPARLHHTVADQVAAGADGGTLDLILSLDGPADGRLARSLDLLGVWHRTFEHLPVAAVRLPVAHLDRLRNLDSVLAVSTNRELEYFLADSAKLMNTGRAWEEFGVTGKDVTIAIVDSGIDFTHPDLAPAMKANVKIPGFGGLTPTVPIEGLANTDTTSGHGTHVAGDAASRGTSSGGKFKGIAHGADLVGIGVGEGINLFTVLQGYEWLLENREQYDIEVVNNSFGISEFYAWDPYDPMTMTTKVATDAGVVVVFANGNSGGEMTMNPYALAPWVIPVAGGSKDGGVADFSSGGIEHDTVGYGWAKFEAEGETRRPLQMGLYHPAITATGAGVISTRSPTGVTPVFSLPGDAQQLPPDQLARYASMSGTSMAAPEAAGYAALLLEANPQLTPAQIRQVMQVTARPIPNVPFYRGGYGYADVSAGVELARELAAMDVRDAARRLEQLQIAKDREVLDGLDHPTRSYSWLDLAPTGLGLVTHKVQVPEGTTRIKVLTNGGGLPQVGLSSYEVTFLDAAGQPVKASSTEASGTNTVELEFHDADNQPAFGEWTMEIFATATAVLPVSVPLVDDLASKRFIATLVSIFGPDAPVPCSPIARFTPEGITAWRFFDDQAEMVAPYPGRAEYSYVGPLPSGSVGPRAEERKLAATFGVFTANLSPPAFTSAPLDAPLTMGGPAQIDVWIQGPSEVVTGLVSAQLIDYDPQTKARIVFGQSAPEVKVKASAAEPLLTEIPLAMPNPHTLPAGHQLEISLDITQLPTAGHTLLYDSDEYPSGMKFTTGALEAIDSCNGDLTDVPAADLQPTPPVDEDPAMAPSPLAGPVEMVEELITPQLAPEMPAVPGVPLPEAPALPALPMPPSVPEVPGRDAGAPPLPLATPLERLAPVGTINRLLGSG